MFNFVPARENQNQFEFQPLLHGSVREIGPCNWILQLLPPLKALKVQTVLQQAVY